MTNFNIPTDFFNLKSREFKDLYYLYLDLCVAKSSRQEIIHALSESMKVSFSFPDSVATPVAKILYEKFSSPSFETSFCDLYETQKKITPFKKPISKGEEDETPIEQQKYFISSLDYERFQKMTSLDPHISAPIKHLLLALMSVYRRNFHHSGWIKYDRKTIFYLAGLQGLPVKEAEELTNYIHQEYGFEMQVVGSNSPIPCFKFAWMFDQPQPGSHVNPFLDFGPLSPETITQISSGTLEPKTIN